jgi:hypothetical protein
MAISSGVGPHLAWITVDGNTFPIEHGSVEQQATNRSSTFSAALPLNYPGALEAFADLGENSTVLTVLTRGNEAPLFTGETDRVEVDLIGGTIRLTGRDKSAQLHENKSSEKWQNRTGSDIVSDLCGRLGIPCQVDSSLLMAGKKLEQDFVRLSDNVSFGQVIHKLSQFDGARWFVDPQGTLHYQTKNNPTGIYTINYTPPSSGYMSADATHLRIMFDVQAGKSVSVSVKAFHPKSRQVFGYTSNVGGRKGNQEYSYHLPNLQMDHVKQHAQAKAEEHSRHEYTVHASVAGDPSISAGMALQLNGTGYFDQQYEMDAVHHEVGMSGHRTSITARAAKSGRAPS